MQIKKVTERPKLAAGRSGEPNPFTDPVADLVKNGGQTATLAAVLSKAEVGEEKTRTVKRNGKEQTETVRVGVERARRQLREAGAANGVTVRSHVVMNDNGSATITFWYTDKQVRKTATPASGDAAGGQTSPEPEATVSA